MGQKTTNLKKITEVMKKYNLAEHMLNQNKLLAKIRLITKITRLKY